MLYLWYGEVQLKHNKIISGVNNTRHSHFPFCNVKRLINVKVSSTFIAPDKPLPRHWVSTVVGLWLWWRYSPHVSVALTLILKSEHLAGTRLHYLCCLHLHVSVRTSTTCLLRLDVFSSLWHRIRKTFVVSWLCFPAWRTVLLPLNHTLAPSWQNKYHKRCRHFSLSGTSNQWLHMELMIKMIKLLKIYTKRDSQISFLGFLEISLITNLRGVGCNSTAH